MTLLLMLSVAMGGEVDRLQDRFLSMRDLVPATDMVRPLDRKVVLEEGPVTLTLEGGWFVPVFSGRSSGDWERNRAKHEAALVQQGYHLPGEDDRGPRAFVGFVWTGGTGSAEVRFEQRGEAMAFSNHMVLKGGGDRSRFASIADMSEPLRTNVETAFVVGVDPRLVSLLYPPEDVANPASLFEVLVLSEKSDGRVAARKASEAFERREWVHEAQPGAGIGERIAWDRLRASSMEQPVGQHLVIGMRTSDRYRRVIPPTQASGPADSWLSVVRDDTGAWGSARRWEVGVVGVTGNNRAVRDKITGIHFPPSVPGDETSARRAPVRLEEVDARAKTWIQPGPTGNGLLAETRTTLRVKAVGGEIAHFDLSLPRHEHIEDSWKITRIRTKDGEDLVGGTPLQDRFLPVEKNEDEEEDARTDEERERDGDKRKPDKDPLQELAERTSDIDILLPKPLQPGEVFEFDVWWEDTWPWASWAACDIEERSWGKGSGLQAFLPSLPTSPPGGSWSFTLRTHVPTSSKLVSAASGGTDGEGETNEWSWVESSSRGKPALWPMVSVGQWFSHKEPSLDGFPAVRAHVLALNSGGVHTFPAEVRRAASFFQRWLPSFPVPELEIIESPAGCGGFVWVAPHGMAAVQQMVTKAQTSSLRDRNPHFESKVFAHELAHQYWGHLVPPASLDDFWIAETFAEVYSCMYIGAAFEPEACATVLKEARRGWESKALQHRTAPLTDAYRRTNQPAIVYKYGPYLFHRMLRLRIGDQAYFQALDLLNLQHPHQRVTTERLQHYMSATSGKDLSDFFDYWVRGGIIPALDLSWSSETRRKVTTVTGTLRSDVPFGTIDVPVRVDLEEGDPVWQWVTIKDGVGTLEVELPAAVAAVVLDPDKLTLASARRVSP